MVNTLLIPGAAKGVGNPLKTFKAEIGPERETFWGEMPKRKRYLAKHGNCSATRNLNYDKKPRLEANPAGFSVESATLNNGATGAYVRYLNGFRT